MKKVSRTILTNDEENVADTSYHLKNPFKEENPSYAHLPSERANVNVPKKTFVASHESRHSQKSHKRFTWCSFLKATVMPARRWEV